MPLCRAGDGHVCVCLSDEAIPTILVWHLPNAHRAGGQELTQLARALGAPNGCTSLPFSALPSEDPFGEFTPSQALWQHLQAQRVNSTSLGQAMQQFSGANAKCTNLTGRP